MDLTQLLGNHPLVTGGAALAVGGYLFALARSLPGRLIDYWKSRVITSVEINSGDHAFVWLERWLAHNPEAFRTRTYTLATYYSTARDSADETPRLSGRRANPAGSRGRQARTGGLTVSCAWSSFRPLRWPADLAGAAPRASCTAVRLRTVLLIHS